MSYVPDWASHRLALKRYGLYASFVGSAASGLSMPVNSDVSPECAGHGGVTMPGEARDRTQRSSVVEVPLPSRLRPTELRCAASPGGSRAPARVRLGPENP